MPDRLLQNEPAERAGGRLPGALAVVLAAVLGVSALHAAEVRAAPPSSPAGASALDPRLVAEADALRRTREILEDKLAARTAELRTRVRALYKLTAYGHMPLWVDPQAGTELVRRRAAARRMILRDLEERRLLVDELANVRAAEQRVQAELAAAAATGAQVSLAPRSWTRPTAGRVVGAFGPYRLADTGVRMVRRGVELSARPGEPVRAVAAGRVRFVGAVRGLGTAVVLEHQAGVTSITGGVEGLEVQAGDRVDAGAPIGRAAGARVVVEARLAGRPVPPPL